MTHEENGLRVVYRFVFDSRGRAVDMIVTAREPIIASAGHEKQGN